MLVLSRKPQEVIVIGQDIKITVLSVNHDQVRIGIEAPPEIAVHRYEVYLSIKEANREAALLGTATQEETAKILANVKRPPVPRRPVPSSRQPQRPELAPTDPQHSDPH
ncbi:MAG: carbon storage regulator CsrA [Acidimicrobiales bacterium]